MLCGIPQLQQHQRKRSKRRRALTCISNASGSSAQIQKHKKQRATAAGATAAGAAALQDSDSNKENTPLRHVYDVAAQQQRRPLKLPEALSKLRLAPGDRVSNGGDSTRRLINRHYSGGDAHDGGGDDGGCANKAFMSSADSGFASRSTFRYSVYAASSVHSQQSLYGLTDHYDDDVVIAANANEQTVRAVVHKSLESVALSTRNEVTTSNQHNGHFNGHSASRTTHEQVPGQLWAPTNGYQTVTSALQTAKLLGESARESTRQHLGSDVRTRDVNAPTVTSKASTRQRLGFESRGTRTFILVYCCNIDAQNDVSCHDNVQLRHKTCI